jgi:hypothetical protein
MGEGYYINDDGYACSQHCMLSILYDTGVYFWTTWEEHSQDNIRDGEPVYDHQGNAYYVTEQLEGVLENDI